MPNCELSRAGNAVDVGTFCLGGIDNVGYIPV